MKLKINTHTHHTHTHTHTHRPYNLFIDSVPYFSDLTEKPFKSQIENMATFAVLISQAWLAQLVVHRLGTREF